MRWTPDLVLQDQPQPFLSCCVLPEHSDDFPCVLEANQKKKTVTTSKPCLFNFPSGLFRFALLLAGSSGPSNAAGSKPILKGRNHFWYRSDTALICFDDISKPSEISSSILSDWSAVGVVSDLYGWSASKFIGQFLRVITYGLTWSLVRSGRSCNRSWSFRNHCRSCGPRPRYNPPKSWTNGTCSFLWVFFPSSLHLLFLGNGTSVSGELKVSTFGFFLFCSLGFIALASQMQWPPTWRHGFFHPSRLGVKLRPGLPFVDQRSTSLSNLAVRILAENRLPWGETCGGIDTITSPPSSP